MKTAGPTEASKTPAGGPGSNRSRSTSPTPSSIARTNRWAGVARVGVLAASDFSALIVAGVAAFELWASRAHGQPAALYLPAAPAAILIVLAYGQGRLYPGFGLGPVGEIIAATGSSPEYPYGLAALVLLLKLDNIYSRMTLAIALGLSLLLVPLFRWLTVRIGRRQQWWPEPVLLLGQAKQGQRVRRLLDRAARRGSAAGWRRDCGPGTGRSSCGGVEGLRRCWHSTRLRGSRRTRHRRHARPPSPYLPARNHTAPNPGAAGGGSASAEPRRHARPRVW